MRILLLAIALSGCSSVPMLPSDGGSDASAADSAGDLQQRVSAILTRSCALSQCHGGGVTPFSLEPARGPLIHNRPSEQVPRLLRIAPGAPENSYLMFKIEGRMSELPECSMEPTRCGSRMPMVGGSLPAEDIATLREWIRLAR